MNESYKACTILDKYIDRFYVFEKVAKEDFELAPILPGTGLELLFYLDKPLAINGGELSSAHAVCPRKIAYFEKQNKVRFLAVRFKSGAFRHFTSMPFSKLNDNYFSVAELWGAEGEILLNKLNSVTEITDKIKEIELFLMEVFHKFHDPKNDKWDQIIDELYYNFDSNSIEKLSKKTTLSLRQFERTFKRQFGITAKEFQKITRFQDSIKKILLNRTSDYLDTILENGYFDQSHFINEFKSLTNKTPKEFFSEERFDSHFYHASIHQKSVE